MVKQIYLITKKFPTEERFGLVSQLNRASVSVASTIAEGSARVGRKDQAHFYQIAYGSLMEVTCQLSIAYELGFVDLETKQILRQRIEEISNKLNALRKAQTEAIQLNKSTTQRFNKWNSHT